MTTAKPKRALIAYCALAERLRKPGAGITSALTPFLTEACQQFAGELFDASKFSNAVAERYGLRIPRLAALGLAEQLSRSGVLTVVSGSATSTVYQYAKAGTLIDAVPESPLTESEVEAVLQSFTDYCRTDRRLDKRDQASLESAFLDRLLNMDSMRILSRRETSISPKLGPNTLVLKAQETSEAESEELHLDFLASQFWLDLRGSNPSAFERVSDVAFANMAAEAIASFREPASAGASIAGLTVYLDSPLLLDMLGVNAEYHEYGRELLDAIHTSGAKPALFDHSVAEAESTIHAQLAYLRSGVNQFSTGWGTTARPDLLSALSGKVGERAEERLHIAVHRDPEVNLHRRAQATVGDIEGGMAERMMAWRNEDAKEYDRKSVWAMLAIRDTSEPCPRLCDCKSLLLTRNTALVSIANVAWTTWLNGATKHASTRIERWAPIAMSDKQFAGYLWARTGGADGAISSARLLAHCSAAVRPRADVKARAYNLVLELSGHAEADDVAALLEDREGANALMRATKGDPEDVTRERLGFILEKVKLAAGEFAAATVREESERQLAEERLRHAEEIGRLKSEADAKAAASDSDRRDAAAARLQLEQDQQKLEVQNAALQAALDAQAIADEDRKKKILQDGLLAGSKRYRACRWMAALLFGLASGFTALIATVAPSWAAFFSVALGTLGFWFVPSLLHDPLSGIAMKRLRAVVLAKDPTGALKSPRSPRTSEMALGAR